MYMFAEKTILSKGGRSSAARRGAHACNGGMPVNEGVAEDIRSSAGRGAGLDGHTQSFMSSRMGGDFSRVKVHTDKTAVQLSRQLGARAFTTGSDIFFNEGQYQPGSAEGKHLLAHELTHVIQQGSAPERSIQRAGMGDVHLAEAIANMEEAIRKSPAFKALDAATLAVTEEIIAETHKKTSWAEKFHIFAKLEELFNTPVKPPAQITAETQASTATAEKAEAVRQATPQAKVDKDLEKKAATDPKRAGHWVPIKGKFGGGTYYVDKTSATDIVVKAKIFIQPTGTGTAKDIQLIKNMQDGIEKAASTKGYIVSIDFVKDTSDPDTFTVDVNPSKWEVATNWSGGDPTGFAHELHHMFAFELDRYNYIESHSTNESMEIPDRLYWFREELRKPAGYNNPTSIMDSAPHPNDDDVCRVAGLDLATCMSARKALGNP
jgi:hypothetical protein